MTPSNVLQARRVWLDTLSGRPLVRDLTLHLGPGERVALVGRNGVGKSSLLEVLAGVRAPSRGEVWRFGRTAWVPQRLDPCSVAVEPGVPLSNGSSRGRASPGERRRTELARARRSRADLLLLDEPTQDLDSDAVRWLVSWLSAWPGALICVTHDRRLLRTFGDFFVLAESGGRHVNGGFDALLADQERWRDEAEQRYVRGLHRLAERERRHDTIRRRRDRKRRLGRLHELGRATSRMRLNARRSYAQESQGRRAAVQRERTDAARRWARAARRSLSVDLPLELVLPSLPPSDSRADPVVELDRVHIEIGGRSLVSDLSLRIRRERIAVTGRNGAGKSKLLDVLTGRRRPERGRARSDASQIGYVDQETTGWCVPESVLDLLVTPGDPDGMNAAARTLRAHRFPLALAERPLRSLSPGERLRAALVCLLQRRPAPALLILDEPTAHLDLLGAAALQQLLAAWRGGLVLATHDPELLDASIGIDRHLVLGPGNGWGSWSTSNPLRARPMGSWRSRDGRPC